MTAAISKPSGSSPPSPLPGWLLTSSLLAAAIGRLIMDTSPVVAANMRTVRLLALSSLALLVAMVAIVLSSGPGSSPQVFGRTDLVWYDMRGLLLHHERPLTAVIAVDQLFAFAYTALFVYLACLLPSPHALLSTATVATALAGGATDLLENSMQYMVVQHAGEVSLDALPFSLVTLGLVAQLKFVFTHFTAVMLGLRVPDSCGALAGILKFSLIFVQAPLGMFAMYFEEDGVFGRARVAFMLFAFSALAHVARDILSKPRKHRSE